MLFSSITFVVFFAIVATVIFILQKLNVKPVYKHITLLLASYVFYGWWDWRFCFLMMGMTVISYLSSIKRELLFFRILGVAVPLIVLGVFKYFNFFIDTFCTLFSINHIGTLNIILPVGISFFTFQSMSYTIDVIRGNQKPVNFLNLALYIAFFPQLVAGPIVKASDFLPQLEENRKITLPNIERGLQIFLFGLFKKIVLADHLSVFVDEVFAAPAAFNALTLILAVISYSLQIYFDFSGYSDMAIGSAKFLGYDFLPNFNMPYISRNLSEFWKRWHISLSTWLQQYLYIPLGGNRRGKARTYLNLMLTMILGGLWHGANWTFVIWGMLHGIGLCIHKLFVGSFSKKHGVSRLSTFICTSLTYVFICICWIFFRAPDFDKAFTIILRIFTWQSGISHMFMWTFVSIIIVVIATFVAVIKGKTREYNGFYPIFNLNSVKGLFILFLFLGLTLGLAYIGDSPFIYFQF